MPDVTPQNAAFVTEYNLGTAVAALKIIAGDGQTISAQVAKDALRQIKEREEAIRV